MPCTVAWCAVELAQSCLDVVRNTCEENLPDSLPSEVESKGTRGEFDFFFSGLKGSARGSDSANEFELGQARRDPNASRVHV